MSYDISLKCPCCKRTLEVDKNHGISGGIYALGRTNELWLNATYNYSSYFYKVLGEKGIRTIYGMTGKESIPVLEKAISELGGTDEHHDYWEPTEGNAIKALINLKRLAELGRKGVWYVD